jgi:FixJ family two-component response regulator
MTAKLIAVVDDDESVRSALTAALQAEGLQAIGFDSAESFLSFRPLADVGCLITDLTMPGMSGIELQSKLLLERYLIPVIFMTAHNVPELRKQAIAAGAIAFLEKPFDDAFLLDTVRKIVEHGAS